MRQQRIEEEAVADSAEREYQVIACCCKMKCTFVSWLQAQCGLLYDVLQ